MNTRIRNRAMVLIVAMIALTAASTGLRADTATCGFDGFTLPFTDVPASNAFFCQIAEAYFTGLTNGTGPTTYSPSANVPREQMAAFVTRTLDQSVKRSSKRAALDQFWNTFPGAVLGVTDVGSGPILAKSDGADIWVANSGSGTVSRVRASDGVKLGEWTGATNAVGVLVVGGKVYVTGETNPGTLYQIDPTQPPGPVTVVSSALGAYPNGIAFDGRLIWTANNSGSVSFIDPRTWGLTNETAGFVHPVGIIFDGQNIWVTDAGDNTLKKLDDRGRTGPPISVGLSPYFPAFDGMNIWVPNVQSSNISVVRAKGSLAGTVLATLNGHGGGTQAAFDGERILITEHNSDSVSLWNASTMTLITEFNVVGGPFGVCSDGVNFWITLFGANKLARF